ncbi:MAG TPA: histidinol dehydrogenase, partial [Firmicutes bacterium]|nr:histidinol dehydrogenase [Bacillota bacterium]
MKIYHTLKQKNEVLQLLNRRAKFQGESQTDLSSKVKTIMDAVKKSGDEALIEFTARFDQVSVTKETLRVKSVELNEAKALVSPEFIQAIQQAKTNILAFHSKQLPKDWLDVKDDGIILGQRIQPVESAG